MLSTELAEEYSPSWSSSSESLMSLSIIFNPHVSFRHKNNSFGVLMFFRNLGVVGIALFVAGCATPVPVTPVCEPLCELESVCDDAVDCSAELVLVSKDQVCQDVEVEVTREICNTYLDTVVTCADSQVSYSAVVTGQGSVSYTDTECAVSGVTRTEVVSGSGTVSYSQLDCDASPASYSETVCGEGSYSYTDTECVDETATQSGEVCETGDVTRHRVVDFESAADGSAIPTGAWGDAVALAYEDWNLVISVTDYDGSPSSTDVATFNSLSPSGGDSDLGTANEHWGGPGEGSGGFDSNYFERGALLIHAEDLGDHDEDGLLDDPDDDRDGAQFSFNFGTTVCVDRLTLVDVEPNENGYLKMYDDSGTEIFNQQIIGLGNNSVQVIDPGVCGVSEVIFEMCGSGALDDLHFSYEEREEVCLDYTGSYEAKVCTDTDVTGAVDVCSIHEYSCSETACVETTVTEDVTTQTDFSYTCQESSCQDTLVTQPVTTSTEYAYTCEETQCSEQQVPIEVCELHTIVETVEVCSDTPTYEAQLSCDTVCEEAEVCDDSVCESENENENEWLSGGGFPGTR